MRVVLTIGLTGLALLQSGSCGANVQNKYLGQLLPGPGRSSITILPASRQAASPSSVVSCILYLRLTVEMSCGGPLALKPCKKPALL